jgi:Ni/Co efflux regulator RcnB
MKTRIAAFALLLMAGAAPAAFAQEQDHRGDAPSEHIRQHGDGQGRRDGGGDHAQRPQPAPAPAPPTAPQPRAAPEAQPPRQGFGGRGGDRGDRPAPAPGQAQTQPQPRQGGYEDGRRFVRRPGTWVDTNGDDTSRGLNPADRADQEDRQDLRDWRRFNGGQGQGGDPRGDHRRPGVQGDPRGDRARDDHRTDDHRTGDHRPDRDHRDRPQWRPGAFPRAFNSPHRFHVRPYIRPAHFFGRVWSYGEILPYGWYGPEYLITDWWDYDLPAPPPGYDWVRVGDDALLIDQYSGRIVQVIRAIFW